MRTKPRTSRSIPQLLRSILRRVNARRHGVDGSLPAGSLLRGHRGALRIGEKFFASGPVWIEAVSSYEGQDFDPTITIGSNTRTSPRLHISAIEQIAIGDWVLFGENVFITDHHHGATAGPTQFGPETAPALRPLAGAAPVRIGDRCQLGNNVVVLPGADIGDGCIIGANAVVSGKVPAGSIAVGVPARVVKTWDATGRRWESTGR